MRFVNSGASKIGVAPLSEAIGVILCQYFEPQGSSAAIKGPLIVYTLPELNVIATYTHFNRWIC